MKIAIVGGIGSGKSEVLAVAKALGYATLSADEVNAELLRDGDYVERLRKLFPTAVKNGVVDKSVLSAIVFSDENERLKLNALAHPEIAKRIKAVGDAVVELPLALESGVIGLFDEIILVRCSLETRLNRLEKRGVDRERAKKIIAVQVPDSALEKVATAVIDNDGTVAELREKATRMLEKNK